jgi:uncharacterized protein YdaU (DUF1376 family)
MANKRVKVFSVLFRRHHIGDHLKETVGLSLAEEGAYVRLLDMAYLNRGLICRPIAEVHASVRAVTKAQKACVEKMLVRYFVKSDAGWRNRKATFDIREMAQISAQRAEVGRKGGLSRGSKACGNRTAVAKQELSNCLANHHPAPSSHQPITKSQQTERAVSCRKQPSAENGGEAALAQLLQRAGCSDATQHHPAIRAAVAEGMDFEALRELAQHPKYSGKPALYLVKTHRGRLATAHDLAQGAPAFVNTKSRPERVPTREPESPVENARAHAKYCIDAGAMTPEEGQALIAAAETKTV